MAWAVGLIDSFKDLRKSETRLMGPPEVELRFSYQESGKHQELSQVADIRMVFHLSHDG